VGKYQPNFFLGGGIMKKGMMKNEKDKLQGRNSKNKDKKVK
jgi:hypothetical protein